MTWKQLSRNVWIDKKNLVRIEIRIEPFGRDIVIVEDWKKEETKYNYFKNGQEAISYAMRFMNKK